MKNKKTTDQTPKEIMNDSREESSVSTESMENSNLNEIQPLSMPVEGQDLHTPTDIAVEEKIDVLAPENLLDSPMTELPVMEEEIEVQQEVPVITEELPVADAEPAPEIPVAPEEVSIPEIEPTAEVAVAQEEISAPDPEPEVTASVEEIPSMDPEPEETAAVEEVPVIDTEPEAIAIAGEVHIMEPEPEPEVTAVLDEEPVAEPEPEPEMPVAVEDIIVPEAAEPIVHPVDEELPAIAELPEISMDHTLEDLRDVVIEEHPGIDYDHFTREQLIEALEVTVNEGDVNAIKNKVALIKVAYLKVTKEEKQEKLEKFLAEGGVKEEYAPEEDSLEAKFQKAFDIYKQNKVKFTEEAEQEKIRNLEAKTHIIEELKVLINSEETLKKTYDDFKILQDKWKQIGMVPRNDANNLWQNYHFLVEKFFDKVKINKELKDLDLKKNLEAKIALCEKSEALLLETSILKSFKQLQKYHEEWKELGPVTQDKKDEIWNRFKDATDKINERRREYYTSIQDEQEGNLMAKNALCDQAEKVATSEIVSLKQWQDATNQLNELQKIWKTIGPGPKVQNDEVWRKFKGYIDNFFTVKKEYFNDIKEEQVHNYNLKLDLCVQAEALKNSTDWKNTTQDMIRLQNEWRKIGPVPRKISDKIWKRFRSACDDFFNNKSNYFANIQTIEQDNLTKKEELIKRVETYEFTEDKKANLDILNSFQREWMEIGHVPIREKDRLQNEFRKAINIQLDQLKISSMEMSAMAYKSKYENLVKESPEAFRIIAREKSTLQLKISKLQEEIHLWENNIGFLAASKKANLLKEEFEHKILKAKEEMKLMEAKLKLLKQA